ncbi:hypothetical protein [Mucilaginibacter sp. HD30]
MPTRVAKYHFSIFEYNSKTNNSAATKAVLDCSRLFSEKGYADHMLTFNNNSERGIKFYISVLKGVLSFLLGVKHRALVGTQYPMLNNVFKYFIIAARSKNIKFFCVIHDIESLRLGGKERSAVATELKNLNYYSSIIVHNNKMKQWLSMNGVTTKMVALQLFDYIFEMVPQKSNAAFSNSIAYAGNLGKSKFVNSLDMISNWKFNLYGPNYTPSDTKTNTTWHGEFSPAQIVNELHGDFGLVWDGDDIDKMDDVLGNYLKYNNPHKLSLYIAAGLPVIVPTTAAIADFVNQHKIGLLVNRLNDLQSIDVNLDDYQAMKMNVARLQKKVARGEYFLTALEKVEDQLISV